MKINISRQHIYLAAISLFLLVFVLVFSFTVLIPKGKEYRLSRVELKKEFKELRKYQDFAAKTEDTLKALQKKDRHIINAFATYFNPLRFEKQHRIFFSSLKISQLNNIQDEEGFAVYEVNTTSHINSPTSFYDFLDAINKSDWVIQVNFPIEFKRDGELINSSFTMKVYANNRDKNTSKQMPKKAEK